MCMYYECTHIISSRYPVERDGILASLSQHPGLWRTWRSTGRRQLPWSLQQQNCMQHVHGVTTISRVVETVSARRPTPRYELRSDLTVLSVGMYSLYIPVPDLPAWSESAECFMLDRDPAKSLYYTLTVSPLLGSKVLALIGSGEAHTGRARVSGAGRRGTGGSKLPSAGEVRAPRASFRAP
jgi:hypothetical protein